MMGTQLLAVMALVLYVAAEGFSVANLRREQPAFGTTTSILLGLGFVAQFAALWLGGRANHVAPYHDLSSSMSLFSWMMTASYGILLIRHREASTGPFLIPLSIVFLGVSLLTQGRVPVQSAKLSGAMFAFHVTIAIFGYAALTLSFVLAQLYLIQNQQIRKRKLGLLFSKLPALDVLSRLHWTSVVIGVTSLTIATVLGLIRAKQYWESSWDPKVLFTILIIVIYLFTLFPRSIGWGGKKVAFLSIAGFVLLMFSYTIVNLFITQEHLFR